MNGPSTLVLSLTLLFAGIGIPIMAAINSGLGSKLGNPTLATVVLFSIALASSTLVLWFQSSPVKLDLATVPPQYFMGGLFVAFYVLAMTFVAPRIGVGNAIFLVLLGQMVSAALIDHHGWLNAPQMGISTMRILGILLVMAGAILVTLSGRLSAQGFS
ncbi:MAG: DMT family transporter [Pseudomonadota bacterium]